MFSLVLAVLTALALAFTVIGMALALGLSDLATLALTFTVIGKALVFTRTSFSFLAFTGWRVRRCICLRRFRWITTRISLEGD